jgi:hypothetical protein
MGTSNSFPGPNNNTPLVPEWLEPDGPPFPEMPNGQPQPIPIPPDEEPQLEQETPAAPPPNRFTTARTNLSRAASSGGNDSASLTRGISHYVATSSGGSRQATRRMGSSRRAGGRLLGFLRDAVERGVDKALEALQLDGLAGHTIVEVLLGMTDYVCPDGGSVDEGITRDSYIEMIVDLAENGVTDLDALNSNQVQTVFELYTTHTIENRLYNDVGTKIVQFPDDAQAVLLIKSQVHDFIHRTVADALSSARDALLSLTQSNIQRFVDRIYLTAFELLRNLAVTEASEL